MRCSQTNTGGSNTEASRHRRKKTHATAYVNQSYCHVVFINWVFFVVCASRRLVACRPCACPPACLLSALQPFECYKSFFTSFRLPDYWTYWLGGTGTLFSFCQSVISELSDEERFLRAPTDCISARNAINQKTEKGPFGPQSMPQGRTGGKDHLSSLVLRFILFEPGPQKKKSISNAVVLESRD